MLTEEYWSERYKTGQTGWDIGYVSTPLKTYFDQLTDRSIAILVPGCGNSYEAEYLLHQGFNNITLIDISAVLVERLQRNLQFYIQNGSCRVIHQDFFTHQGRYNLIIEQTFLSALDPSLRSKYAEQMYNLLKPKGRLAGVIFDFTFAGGPPFGGSKEEYLEMFKPYFQPVIFERCYNSIPPRAGNELFIRLDKL
ncbi:methyltransferase domain-containing protein [Emticicia sp. 21SJ11W-3]|uniref:methyltransferase domain-containing protein n=1 Tax=Emticicia sp. 21SJ11W-3 TaxID=2916755 RepID=UPI00209D0BC9|nr:methyltransferase [Emticicia sp. 21SJ11W-3]UTA68779.1 TPMT family class I SAM-dependent methyltransferase [Emticicia sp. 21SJ11W-3]